MTVIKYKKIKICKTACIVWSHFGMKSKILKTIPHKSSPVVGLRELYINVSAQELICSNVVFIVNFLFFKVPIHV